jgi:hypothetical protein
MGVGVYRAVENHILRLLADGEMPYRALRKAVVRDLGSNKLAVCRVVNRLDKTGQIERIVPAKGKQFEIVRIATGMLKRAALMEMANRARASFLKTLPQAVCISEKPAHIQLVELARRARSEREQQTVRAVPSDPLGRWWIG